MTIHCSNPAWEIPWTKEPGRLQATGSQRVRYDCALNNNKQEVIIIRIRSHCSLSTICYLTEAPEVRSGDTQLPLRRPFTEDSSSSTRGRS